LWEIGPGNLYNEFNPYKAKTGNGERRERSRRRQKGKEGQGREERKQEGRGVENRRENKRQGRKEKRRGKGCLLSFFLPSLSSSSLSLFLFSSGILCEDIKTARNGDPILRIDGPFGAASEDIWDYKYLVLVAAGEKKRRERRRRTENEREIGKRDRG
jgi:hypothetical protein